jgi:hypothetical protein
MKNPARHGIILPSELAASLPADAVIDILATDADGGFYVFELKRAKTPDAVIERRRAIP